MKRYCLALDLKNDPLLIAAYEKHHQQVWPEIIQSIRTAGIERMDIYRTGTRMCMIMEVNEHFSFERKAAADAADPKVQQWLALMSLYFEPLPWAGAGENWMLMDKIFSLPV